MLNCVYLLLIMVVTSTICRPRLETLRSNLPSLSASVRRLHQLALLKSRILSGLRLPTPPEVNETSTKPPISTLVFSQLNYGTTLVARNTKKNNMVVILSEPTDEVHTLKFKMKGYNSKVWKTVKSAHLLIRLRSKQHKVKGKKFKGKRQNIKTRGMKIIIHGFHPKRRRMKRLAVRKVRLRKEKWLNLKLPMRLLRKMTKTKHKDIYLKITCKRCEKWANIDMVYIYRNSSNPHRKRKEKLNDYRPYIILQKKSPSEQENSKQRKKRDLNDTCISDMTSCCTQRMNVTMAELGWENWILYPQSFETGICTGSCNEYTDDLDCQPAHRFSLTLIYMKSQNKIVRQTLPNIIDSGCTCSR